MTRLSISVCVPTIPGREHLLERCLASIEGQHRKPDAVLVEPDPDRTGAAATRNRLLARVETDLIAWVDDDDALMRNHCGALERMLGDFDLIYPTPRMVGGDNPAAVTVNGVWCRPWGVYFGREQEAHLRTLGSFIPITHLSRVSTLRRAGGFPEGVTLPDGRYSGEDEQMLVAMLDAGARFTHLNVVTWKWFVHDSHSAGKGIG